MPTSGSPSESGTTNVIPSRNQLNEPYLQHVKPNKYHIYGFGSAQYRDFNPSTYVLASLAHNMDVDKHISGLETNFEAVKEDITTVKGDVLKVKNDIATIKGDVAATLAAINLVLQNLGVNTVTLPTVSPAQPNNASPTIPVPVTLST